MRRRTKEAARKAIDELIEGRKRAPRLAQIAALVNEHFPSAYSATVEPSWSSTDRPLGRTRLRIAGKGRRGNRLIVTRNGTKVVDHDSSQTYRENGEALEKVGRLVDHPEAWTFVSKWAKWRRRLLTRR